MSLLINFKRVYTTQIFRVRVDPSWTIRTFITNAKNYLSEQTQISFADIEIVEAGTKLKEQEISLEQNSNLDIKFKDHFRLQSYAPAFYLRVRGETRPMTIISNLLDNCPECPVCLTTNLNNMRLVCNHYLCTQCYSKMSTHRLTSCPLCRHSISYV